MKRMFSIVPLVAVLVWSAACASRKAPAETALKAAEAAWAEISAEATRYVPDLAKGIDDALATARQAFDRGNYEAALKDATDLPAKIADVQKALTDKKSEWTAAWTTLGSTLGTGLTAIQGKVDELLAAKKLPAGVTKATVDGAKATLATAEQAFTDAKSAYAGGDYAGALAKANQVRAQLAQVATDLKLDMPLLKEAGSALADSAKETIQGVMEKK